MEVKPRPPVKTGHKGGIGRPPGPITHPAKKPEYDNAVSTYVHPSALVPWRPQQSFFQHIVRKYEFVKLSANSELISLLQDEIQRNIALLNLKGNHGNRL